MSNDDEEMEMFLKREATFVLDVEYEQKSCVKRFQRFFCDKSTMFMLCFQKRDKSRL